MSDHFSCFCASPPSSQPLFKTLQVTSSMYKAGRSLWISRCGPLWLYNARRIRHSMPSQTYAKCRSPQTKCLHHNALDHPYLPSALRPSMQVHDQDHRPDQIIASSRMLITVRAKVLSIILQLPNQFAHMSKYTQARWCQLRVQQCCKVMSNCVCSSTSTQ